MKAAFIAISLLHLCIFPHFGQELQVKWGSEYPKEEMTEYLPWLGYNDNYIFKVSRTRSDKYILSRFDYQLKKLSEEQLNLESLGKDHWVAYFYSLKSKCYIVCRSNNGRSGEMETYVIEISADGKANPPRKIAAVKFETKGKSNDDTWGFAFSPDSSFITLLHVESDAEMKGPERFHLYLFDAGFSQQWARQVTMSYEDKDITIGSISLSAKGEVYLAATLKKENAEKGLPDHDCLIIKINENEILEHKVAIEPGKGPLQHGIFSIDGNVTVIGGTFKSAGSGKDFTSGFFFQKIELAEKRTILSKSYDNEIWEANLRDLVRGDDGYILIIQEESSKREIVQEGDRNVQITHYMTFDIIIPMFSADGELLWTGKIEKDFSWTKRAYTGYFFACNNDKMCFLFNDSKDRKELADADVSGKYHDPTVTDLAIIDNKGNETYRKPLFHSEETIQSSNMFSPAKCLLLKNNVILLFQEITTTTLTRDGYRLGILSVF